MIGQLFNTLANCLKIPELRSRILFTALVLAVARVIALTPVPGLDGSKLALYFAETAKTSGGGVFGLYSMFTGGALEQCAVGALGIMPYISATIFIQLLTAVVAPLGKLAREEGGRAKLVAYGRYLTVLLCFGSRSYCGARLGESGEGFPRFLRIFGYGRESVALSNSDSDDFDLRNPLSDVVG